MPATIYMDESGDLGWTFSAPYQQGGSSRYLTLAAIVVPVELDYTLCRIVRGVYKHRNRPMAKELKSIDLSAAERARIAGQLVALCQSHPGVTLLAITVSKPKVYPAFQRHPNGLYNYLAKRLLLEAMRVQASVHLVPDARSIKVELKHALHDYLRTELAAAGADTELQTNPQESKHNLALQAADILANIVWSHHEFGGDANFARLGAVLKSQTLFF